MRTIVINAKNDTDLQFRITLAKKNGIKAITLDTKEIEDALIAGLIEKGLKTKNVSEASVLKVLRK